MRASTALRERLAQIVVDEDASAADLHDGRALGHVLGLVPRLEPGRVRIPLDAGQHGRDSAIRLGDPRDAAACVACQPAVGGASPR